MSTLAIRLRADEQRSLAFGSIGAAYMGIGAAFSHPIRIIFVQNLTDALLQFSFDGVTDHFPLPSNGFLLLDIMANKTNFAEGFYIAEGYRLYVKEIGSPSSGAVYVSNFYGEGAL
jgi:hypothetical protein